MDLKTCTNTEIPSPNWVSSHFELLSWTPVSGNFCSLSERKSKVISTDQLSNLKTLAPGCNLAQYVHINILRTSKIYDRKKGSPVESGGERALHNKVSPLQPF